MFRPFREQKTTLGHQHWPSTSTAQPNFKQGMRRAVALIAPDAHRPGPAPHERMRRRRLALKRDASEASLEEDQHKWGGRHQDTGERIDSELSFGRCRCPLDADATDACPFLPPLCPSSARCSVQVCTARGTAARRRWQLGHRFRSRGDARRQGSGAGARHARRPAAGRAAAAGVSAATAAAAASCAAAAAGLAARGGRVGRCAG